MPATGGYLMGPMGGPMVTQGAFVMAGPPLIPAVAMAPTEVDPTIYGKSMPDQGYTPPGPVGTTHAAAPRKRARAQSDRWSGASASPLACVPCTVSSFGSLCVGAVPKQAQPGYRTRRQTPCTTSLRLAPSSRNGAQASSIAAIMTRSTAQRESSSRVLSPQGCTRARETHGAGADGRCARALKSHVHAPYCPAVTGQRDGVCSKEQGAVLTMRPLAHFISARVHTLLRALDLAKAQGDRTCLSLHLRKD